jgi:hypothetical protein
LSALQRIVVEPNNNDFRDKLVSPVKARPPSWLGTSTEEIYGKSDVATFASTGSASPETTKTKKHVPLTGIGSPASMTTGKQGSGRWFKGAEPATGKFLRRPAFVSPDSVEARESAIRARLARYGSPDFKGPEKQPLRAALDANAGLSHEEDFREDFREKYASLHADEAASLAARNRVSSATDEAPWERPRGRYESPLSEIDAPEEEPETEDPVGLDEEEGYAFQDDSTSSDSILSHTARTYGRGASRGRKGKGKVSRRTDTNTAFQEKESYTEISFSRENTRKRSVAEDTEALRRKVTSADSFEGASHTEDFREKSASLYASRAQASRDEVGSTDPNEVKWQQRSASPAPEKKVTHESGNSWYIDRVPLETYFEEDEDMEDPDISRDSRAKLYETIANQVAHSTTSRDEIYKRLANQATTRSEDFREKRASPYFNYDRNPDAETSGKSNEAAWLASNGRR